MHHKGQAGPLRLSACLTSRSQKLRSLSPAFLLPPRDPLAHNQFKLGNLLCKFRFPFRRRSRPGRNGPLGRLVLDAQPSPVRDHPAAPSRALGPGHRLFHRDHRPLQAIPHIEPQRRYPIPQAACTSLGVLPLVNWSNPQKKPVLSSRNSLMFGPSRGVRIPPLGRKVTLPPLLSERVEAGEPVPSRHRPLLCPSGMEEKVQENPREKMEDLVETKGEDGGNRAPHSCGDIPLKSSPSETRELLSFRQCKPAPLDIHPNPPEDSLRKNTNKSLINSSTEGHVVTSSHGPDPEAAMLSDPTKEGENHQSSESPSDLSRKEVGDGQPSGMTSTKEVSGENHQPVGDTSLSIKKKQVSEPSGNSSGSSFPPVSASRRLCKRKRSMPSSLPLPPPQQLLWDHSELPPPPKLPCIGIDKNLNTLKNTKRNKILEERTQSRADCSDSQPAPAVSVLAPATANCLPLASNTLQVPIPTADLADPSARPPIPSVPPSLTPNIGQETANTVFKPSPAVPAGSLPPLSSNPIQGISLKSEGPLQPVTATTSICDVTTLPNTSTSTVQPPSCKAESPEPMCVDLPPPVPPTPLPNPSTNSAAYFQGAQKGPPSSSQDRPNLKQKHPENIPVSTSAPGYQKTALLASVAVPTSLPLGGSGVTSAPVGNPPANCNSASDEAMDTTSPSQASIFYFSPVVRDNRVPLSMVLPGSDKTPTTSSTVVAQDSIHLPKRSSITQTSVANQSGTGITSQPTTGHHYGQQPNNSNLLGSPITSTQAMGPTAHVAKQPRDNTVQSGLAGSASSTTNSIQPTSSGPPQRPCGLPGHSISVTVASGSTNSMHGPTCKSIHLPNGGPPAQHTDSKHGGPTCKSIHLPNNDGPPAQHTDSKHGGPTCKSIHLPNNGGPPAQHTDSKHGGPTCKSVHLPNNGSPPAQHTDSKHGGPTCKSIHLPNNGGPPAQHTDSKHGGPTCKSIHLPNNSGPPAQHTDSKHGGPTCKSICLPNNGGPPAKHTDSKHGGDNTIPTMVGPGILPSQQNNCSRPNANAASAVADIDIIISMMTGIYVSTPYKNNGSSCTPKKDGALGKSSMPAKTN